MLFSFKSLSFRLPRFFSSMESILKDVKILHKPTSTYLLTCICSHPNIVKNPDFKTVVKLAISDSLDKNPHFSKPDIFLIRMLLTFSKFANSDYDWRGVIYRALQNFNEKNLNIYDISMIMSVYYDALRRYFEIKGRENDFFQDKKTLFAKEKEYNMALSLNFKNFTEFFQVWRGKNIEGKLFYELVLERFFTIIEENGDKNFEEIMFFYKIYIGFEFRNAKFEGFFYELLKKNSVSLKDLTEIYLIYFRKNNFAFPDIFGEFLQKIQENLLREEKIEIFPISEPHLLYLQPNYLRILLGNTIELAANIDKSREFLSNGNLLDVYWMLSRNFDPRNVDLLLKLQEKLSFFLDDFLLKDLILFLISRIYHNLTKNPLVLDNYEEILMKIAEKLEKEITWEIINTKSVSGSLFLAIKYLNLIGYSELITKKFDKSMMIFLEKQWSFSTRNRKNSNSEKIIREIVKEIIDKNYKKKVKFGGLAGELYYCDIIIGDRHVIEINGDQHYNVFFKNKEVKEEKYRYIGNFMLKKEILKKQGYCVTEINEETYLKFLYEKEKLKAFLQEFLANFFKENP